MQPHERRIISRYRYYDGPRQALFTQVVPDEFRNLAATFADQTYYNDIGLGIFGHHSQQHALADSTARK